MKIFVSYSHQNSSWVDVNGKYGLIPWLKRQLAGESVTFWTDHNLDKHIGEEYRKNIFSNILDSDIAILLISQEFASSEFIFENELPWIKERFKDGKLKIIPLLLSKVGKKGKERISWIFDLQTIPNDFKPLLEYTVNEVDWHNIKVEILDVLTDKKEQVLREKKEKEGVGEKDGAIDGELGELGLQDYQKAAEKGDPMAQYNLGVMYDNGQGVSQDYAKAVEWYRKAAEQGYPKAQYNLGVMYHFGQGVSQDFAKAIEWFRKVAEQGVPMAQFSLGVMYDNGWGVSQDYVKAIEWFTKAAEQENAIAQYNLGIYYYYGYSVEKNYRKAVEWFSKAAKQGIAEAQNMLGVCYSHGYGVEKNFVKASECYSKAAEQGHTSAQYNLGVCYYNGEGVGKNYEKAVEWFTKAAEQEYDDARRALKDLKQ